MIVFLPQRITDSQAGLLRAVGEATDTTIVAGATGAEDADAAVVASVGRLGAEFDAPARRDGRGQARATVEALSVSDADDEVRHAVRAVVDAARAGTPWGDAPSSTASRAPTCA